MIEDLEPMSFDDYAHEIVWPLIRKTHKAVENDQLYPYLLEAGIMLDSLRDQRKSIIDDPHHDQERDESLIEGYNMLIGPLGAALDKLEGLVTHVCRKTKIHVDPRFIDLEFSPLQLKGYIFVREDIVWYPYAFQPVFGDDGPDLLDLECKPMERPYSSESEALEEIVNGSEQPGTVLWVDTEGVFPREETIVPATLMKYFKLYDSDRSKSDLEAGNPW